MPGDRPLGGNESGKQPLREVFQGDQSAAEQERAFLNQLTYYESRRPAPDTTKDSPEHGVSAAINDHPGLGNRVSYTETHYDDVLEMSKETMPRKGDGPESIREDH